MQVQLRAIYSTFESKKQSTNIVSWQELSAAWFTGWGWRTRTHINHSKTQPKNRPEFLRICLFQEKKKKRTDFGQVCVVWSQRWWSEVRYSWLAHKAVRACGMGLAPGCIGHLHQPPAETLNSSQHWEKRSFSGMRPPHRKQAPLHSGSGSPVTGLKIYKQALWGPGGCGRIAGRLVLRPGCCT